MATETIPNEFEFYYTSFICENFRKNIPKNLTNQLTKRTKYIAYIHEIGLKMKPLYEYVSNSKKTANK